MGVLAYTVHTFLTVELSEELTWLEELHLAVYWLGFAVACNSSVWAIYLGPWWGLGIGTHGFLTYISSRIAIIKMREAIRAHQLRQGTLGAFVDDVFIQFTELTGIR